MGEVDYLQLNSPANPFTRGYKDYVITYLVSIVDTHTHKLQQLPLHDLQQDLDPSELVGETGSYCHDFVLLDNDPNIPENLWGKCNRTCVIVNIVYRVTASQHTSQVACHLGDFASKEEAQALIDNIAFKTGEYSRCWEISSSHLSQEAIEHLYQAIASQKDYDSLMFNLFVLPSVDSSCIAVKLLATPWTNRLLTYQFNLTVNHLRALQVAAGLPECFINILQLAAMADTRLLVFDPLARPLAGLPIYEHQ